MAITIGSNIPALQAQRRLSSATAESGKVYQRLASGQRINTASDDAAGLAISLDLNAGARVFGQGIRNINDGISFLSVADATVSNLSSVLIRIRELSEQAANGTFGSAQRKALDMEAQAIAKEYFRVSHTASFNNVGLFDGSLGDGVRFQIGYGTDGSIASSLGGKLGTGTVSGVQTFSAESRQSSDVRTGDFNHDGIIDIATSGYTDAFAGVATIRLGTGNGTFGAATSYTMDDGITFDLAVGDLNNDGVLDLITAGNDGIVQGTLTVRLGRGDGTFNNAVSYLSPSAMTESSVALADVNNDGYLDVVSGGLVANGVATVRLGLGNGRLASTSVSYDMETANTNEISLADVNNDGAIDIVTAGVSSTADGYATVRLGTGRGTFNAAVSYAMQGASVSGLQLGDLNNDGRLDMITTGDDGTGSGATIIRLGGANGTFGAATTLAEAHYADLALADVNGDDILDILSSGDSANDAYISVRLGRGNGTFNSAVTSNVRTTLGVDVAYGINAADINGDGVNEILVSMGVGTDGELGIVSQTTRDGISPIQPFSLRTKADALQSMAMIDQTLNNILKQRGVIGAFQSRLSSAYQTLQGTRVNYIAANSRIIDADIAEESSKLLSTQILQQTAAAVLSQANQLPRVALELIKG